MNNENHFILYIVLFAVLTENHNESCVNGNMTQKPIVETRAGKLQGEYIDGVYRFLGVRYAQAPIADKRFLPPQPLEPWKGIRSATEHIEKCWQTDVPVKESPECYGTRVFHAEARFTKGSCEIGVGEMTEDCLGADIWTSGINDGQKRPVMVWLHGGGNVGGQAAADWHDGYHLAHEENVVVVNVGHRLNILGYLYLAGFGNEKYKDAVNLGNQDMVAALQWIHDNIEAFGGDPDNVTIFGQSGGGEKVATLLAMPAARGLVHKAIVQSGGFRMKSPDDAMKATMEFLAHIGVDKDNLDELQKIPAADLIAALRQINSQRSSKSGFLIFPTVMDGKHIAYDPFDGAEGTAFNKDVPLLHAYCKDDSRVMGLFHPALFRYTFEEVPEKMCALGYTLEQAKQIFETYRKVYPPDATPSDIFFAFVNDQTKLRMNIDWYNARKKAGCAPMYNCVFCFDSPDYELKAFHGCDVPLTFGNSCFAPGTWNADTHESALRLAKKVSAAWANFARTGNPNVAGIPMWKPYDDETRCTMLFEAEPRVIYDYHSYAREILDDRDPSLVKGVWF
jgi:para-nitrobenzyl esterase